ncbi:Ribokinase [Rhodovastum atsumiense]|uniref:Ribokinase n=1 Tax=Rhodovastum atsumiense TaxID=504468 RepID=A0A5M6IV12_9PROT|nr:ribokinase [Rhodovastum atsumiense]KAA5611388.1 ribokinase [Rhodovastum atsumiense]CAH2603603.1 Ribokinase [Rhodovastum atsumiense]
MEQDIRPHRTTATQAPLVVFGSVNIDIVAYTEHLPHPGETIHADRSATTLGGKGANQAAAIARLGGRVVLAGRTGTDAFATLARDRLAAFGVGLGHLAADPDRATGLALIGVSRDGQNSITVIGGANLGIDTADAAALQPVLAAAPVLLLQLEIPLPAVLAAAATAREGGATVILDPAPAPAGGLPEAAFQVAHILTPNETETELLVGMRPTGPDDAALAAGKLLDRGLATAIIKLGSRGVYYRSRTAAGFVPPFAVTAIDSVAAGDSFNAGLAVALARGDTLAEAVRFAAAGGALATTRPGASEAAPTLAEVENLLRRQPPAA